MDVQAKGRLVYIEPNNIRKELGMKFGNGDNISWRPEDLNLSVDLQVIIPDRDSCGQADIGDNFVVNISSIENAFKGNEWQSFMGGNTLAEGQNYLTTEYTNISFQEIRNNKAGGKENLGIQSIDIQFDSHFFPIVKMKMIDVHGYSLMMPAEEQYRSDLENRAKKKPQEKVCEQFFNALFHFPYPRFALSIKGFYGNRVTFMLAVNDFQSNFNSQTGNFEVEISFIGHMYGVYADIPLSLLLVAPYINSKDGNPNAYWRQQISNGTFFFSDGITQIPTLKDFVVKYEEMDENFKDAYTSNGEEFKKIAKVDALRLEIRALNNLSQKYDKLFEDIGRDERCTKRVIENGILYFTTANSLTAPSNEEFRSAYNYYLDAVGTDNALDGPADINTWETIRKTENPLYSVKEVTTNGTEYSDTIVEGHPYKEKLDGKIIKPTEIEKGQRTLLVEKDKDFLKRIENRINDINKEIPTLLSESSEELNEISRRLLGFVPTVENVMRMIFAHIDAFMTSFYGLLGNIKSKMNGERLLKNAKGLSLDDTDIESKDDDKCFIPPFAAYYENDPVTNKRVRMYPNDNPALKNFDEVRFVNDIYDSIFAIREEMLKSQNKTEREIQQEVPKDEWTLLSLLDVLEKENPYRKFMPNSNPKTYVEELIKFIDKRFYDATVVTGKSKKTTVDDINAEVENFWAVHKKALSVKSAFVDEIIQVLSGSTDTKKVEDILKDATYGAPTKSGFYFLDENSTETYSDKISNIDLEWNYEKGVDNDFAGNIYPEGTVNLNLKEKKNRGDFIRLSRGSEDRYCLPVIPYYPYTSGKSKYGLVNALVTDSRLNTCSSLVDSLVGTGDIYRFNSKGESSLLRMPKIVALFLGRTINSTEERFSIEENGLRITAPDFNGAEKLSNKTPAELRALDGNGSETNGPFEIGGLQKYFLEWEQSEGKDILEQCKNWTASTGNSIKVTKSLHWGLLDIRHTDYSMSGMTNNESNREIQTKLLKLVNSTVDFVYLNFDKKIDKSYDPVIAFVKALSEKIKEATKTDSTLKNGDTETRENSSSSNGTTERAIKNQLYYTLSDLYDKWLAGYSKDRFLLKKPEQDKELARKKSNGEITCSTPTTEIENFVYIDTFYNDIGDVFLIDPKSIVDILLAENTNRSVIQLITDIAQQNKLLFIALPVFTNFYDKESIASVFTPQGIYGENEFTFNKRNSRGIGNTYVIMYTHEPSRIANVSKNAGNSTTYKDDALDLADTTGNISPIALNDLESNASTSGHTIPAFGVTFAAQNQMYFKNINVSMANPRQTDTSIQNTFILAEMERKGDTRNTTNTVGQNLYSIYSNRAYDCVVDMMGCMDIMPTMYFQVNNIPLFKGAYRIVGVKHHIENGSMTTTFSGTRISKNAIPFNNNVIDIESLINKMRNVENSGEEGNVYAPFNFGGEHYPGMQYDPKKVNNDIPVFNVATAIAAFKSKNPKMPVGVSYAADSIYNNTESLSRCATAVKLAVNAGMIYNEEGKDFSNITKWTGGYNGWRCNEILTGIGFTFVESGICRSGQDIQTKSALIPGDVAVINPHKDIVKKGDPNYGHICMYDGGVWISDYRQTNGPNCYKSYDNVYWEIYRYGGRTVLPTDYQAFEFELANGHTATLNGTTITKDSEFKTIIVKSQQYNGNSRLYAIVNFDNGTSFRNISVKRYADRDTEGSDVPHREMEWDNSAKTLTFDSNKTRSLLSCRFKIVVK